MMWAHRTENRGPSFDVLNLIALTEFAEIDFELRPGITLGPVQFLW